MIFSIIVSLCEMVVTTGYNKKTDEKSVLTISGALRFVTHVTYRRKAKHVKIYLSH